MKRQDYIQQIEKVVAVSDTEKVIDLFVTYDGLYFLKNKSVFYIASGRTVKLDLKTTTVEILHKLHKHLILVRDLYDWERI
jgi:hypothetical protein